MASKVISTTWSIENRLLEFVVGSSSLRMALEYEAVLVLGPGLLNDGEAGRLLGVERVGFCVGNFGQGFEMLRDEERDSFDGVFFVGVAWILRPLDVFINKVRTGHCALLAA